MKTLEEVLSENPTLSYLGLCPTDRTAETVNKLKNATKEISMCIDWIKDNVRVTKAISTKRTSYGLKHNVERYFPDSYIANGSFIAAALMYGFKHKRVPNDTGRNAYFNMTKPLDEGKFK